MSTDLDHLIGDIYSAILGDTPWNDLLRKFRMALDLRWCSVCFRPGDTRRNFIAYTDADESMNLRQTGKAIRTKYAHEKGVPHFALSPGEIYNPRLNPEYMQSGYYNDLVTLSGDVHELVIRINDTDSADAWIFLGRRAEYGEFMPEQIEGLEKLSPHLVRAMKIFTKERFYQSLMSINDATLSDIGKGVVVLDSEGNILHRNDTVKRLLSTHRAFVVADKQLNFRDPDINTAYVKYRESIAASREREIETNRVAENLTNIRCDCGTDVSVLMRPVPVLDKYWGANTPCLVMYMIERKHPDTVSAKSLLALFGFTKTEARLVQRIAEGVTLSEASENLGMGLGTARNHLKRIFRKVGVSRQSDLIIAVNESVLPLSQIE